MSTHDPFDAIVADLTDLADLDDTVAARPHTPVLDALLEWRIHDGRIVVTAAAQDAIVLAAALDTLDGTLDIVSLFDADPEDLRTVAVAARADEFATEAEKNMTAAKDLLSGGIPLSAAFDAARGFQAARLRFLDDSYSPPNPAFAAIAEPLALLCAGFAADMLTLALL